jgi:hypothetical protein
MNSPRFVNGRRAGPKPINRQSNTQKETHDRDKNKNRDKGKEKAQPEQESRTRPEPEKKKSGSASDWYHSLRAPKPNFKNMSFSEKHKQRYVYLNKYSLLRILAPKFKIPDPPNHWTLEEIYDDYEEWLRKIYMGQTVTTYTKYLWGAMAAIEIIGITLLKLPMKGFTLSQYTEKASYQLMLMEMGEITTSSGGKSVGSEWPVYVRLSLSVVFNTVLFLIIQMIQKWSGTIGLTIVKNLLKIFRDDNNPATIGVESQTEENEEQAGLNLGTDGADGFIEKISRTIESVNNLASNAPKTRRNRHKPPFSS